LSKSGIVSLVGRPSVGKSTLINNLVKQKVSIVTLVLKLLGVPLGPF